MKYDIIIDSLIGYPISKGYIRSLLKKYKNKPVAVRINSYGGDVQHALDIRQQFVDHGDVTVYIYGMTASAATIVATGAKKIVMSKYATMMIHNCSGWVDTWGPMNAQQIAEAIKNLSNVKDQLDKVDEIIVNTYGSRSNTDIKKIAEVMARGEWLNAAECLSLGLIDEISDDGKETEITDGVKSTLAACGLPVPGGSSKTKVPEETAQQTNNIDTVCRTFIDNIVRFLGMEKKPAGQNVEEKTENKQDGKSNSVSKENLKTVNIIDMKKYKALSAIEGISDLTASAEGSVTFTRENLEKLEDKVSSLEAKVKDLESENKKKDEQIEALGKKDGDVTNEVHEEAKTSETFEDIYKNVQKYVH